MGERNPSHLIALTGDTPIVKQASEGLPYIPSPRQSPVPELLRHTIHQYAKAHHNGWGKREFSGCSRTKRDPKPNSHTPKHQTAIRRRKDGRAKRPSKENAVFLRSNGTSERKRNTGFEEEFINI